MSVQVLQILDNVGRLSNVEIIEPCLRCRVRRVEMGKVFMIAICGERRYSGVDHEAANIGQLLVARHWNAHGSIR